MKILILEPTDSLGDKSKFFKNLVVEKLDDAEFVLLNDAATKEKAGRLRFLPDSPFTMSWVVKYVEVPNNAF